MDEDRGELLARWTASRGRERSEARLRQGAALLGAAASVATYALHPPLVGQLMATVGLLVSVGWFFAGRNARARGRDPESWSLAVHERGLLLLEGARRQWVPWSAVGAVEVDEERLEVVLKRTSGAPVRVVPRYPGVAIDELAQTLRQASGCAASAEGVH